MRKKILILANNDVGLYKFRKELIKELLKQNDVFICLPDGDFVRDFEEMGCKFIPCDLERHGTNPIKELHLIKEFKTVVKSCAPDVVLTYTIKPNIYGGLVCASLGVPYIVNITGLGTAVENPGILQKALLMMYRYALRKAKKVFFQNTYNRDFMIAKKVVKKNYDLLPGSGVNLDQYSILDYPTGDTVDFVFIARIMREKGIEQYLDAARYIRKKYPNTRFHVCGECEQDYGETLRLLSDEEIIIYHGLVKDMVKMYESSACTILPTYYPEGLSNVLLESSACARPIITTDRAGCREVIDDGVNGFVVKPQDSADLIEKIERFLALSFEERKAMGLAGRAKVEKEFSRQIIVEKYLREIENGL